MLGRVVALPLGGRPVGLWLAGLFPPPLLLLDLGLLLSLLILLQFLLHLGLLLLLLLAPALLLLLLPLPGLRGSGFDSWHWLPLGPGVLLLGAGVLLLLGPRLLALRTLLGCLVSGIRLLPFGPGFLLRVRTPRLLFALVMLRIGRCHGLEQQRQHAHIDKSKGLHGAYLL
jgi:hypothetical protein